MGGAGEMEDGTGWGRAWGENGEGMDVPEMEIREKIALKRNKVGIWGRFLEAIFQDNISFADNMPLS